MNSVEIWNDLGNLYIKGNAFDAAIDAYNKAIEQGFNSAELYQNLAGAYASQGNVSDSILSYQKSIDLLSDDKEKALVYTRLGDCYRRMGDIDGAIASFRTAIELEPGNPELCLGLSAVQDDLEKFYSFLDGDENTNEPLERSNYEPEMVLGNVEIEAIVTEESHHFPVVGFHQGEMDLPAELTALSTVEIEQKPEYQDAIAAADDKFEEVEVPLIRTLFPGHSDDDLSDLNIDSGQNFEGEINLEKAEGVRVTLLLTLGIMHWRNGNLEEADDILQSAIKASVNIKNSWFEALSWHALALVKTALADITGAIHAYLQAVELAPEQILPWNNLGNLYGSMGATDEAMDAFQKAIKQNPEDSTSWDGVGDIYTKLGRLDDAIAAYQLGNIFENRMQGSDAIKTYEKAFGLYRYTISTIKEEAVNNEESSSLVEKLKDIRTTSAVELDLQMGEPIPGATVPALGTSEKNDGQEDAAVVEPEAIDSDIPEASSITDTEDNQVDDHQQSAKAADDFSVLPVLEMSLPNIGFEGSEIPSEGEHETSNSDHPEESGDVTEPWEAPIEQLNAQAVIENSAVLQGSVEIREEMSEDEDLIIADSQNDFQTAPVEEMILPGETDFQQITCEQAQQLMDDYNAGLEKSEVEITHTTLDQDASGDGLEKGVTLDADELYSESLQPGVITKFDNEVLVTDPASEPMNEVKEPIENSEENMPVVEPVQASPITDAERLAGKIATYEAVVKQNPMNDRAWDSLGNLYRITQRNGDAIRAFEQAVSLEPEKYVYHYQLGSLYAAEGNYLDAIREIQKVVELNQTFIFAHCALASYFRKLGLDAEAQEHISLALPFMEKEKEYDRACFESIRGNTDRALELLTVALEKKQTTIEWIRRDLDLDFIRQDSRYEMLETRYTQSVIDY